MRKSCNNKLIFIDKNDEMIASNMELKKQLAIIPPMSEPLQKLNEVLDGIANDENIEISIIDDPKELAQFLGSAGQCLITFSNAKKCATFLQENRAMIQKSHTKVILLSPKEIPAKTLSKFTKIGLTEAILETSPPKTLLYKVKLLLRSIKSSSGKQDSKDQVVKSMIDINQSTGIKGELNAEREHLTTEHDFSEEDYTKNKNPQEENTLNYDDHLKTKAMTHEDMIETHWKSKRKVDESSLFENEKSKREEEEKNLNEIDMYYRGKRKTNQIEELEIEKAEKKREDDVPEELLEQHLKQKHFDETIIDLEVTKKQEKEDEEINEEKQSNYTLNPSEELSLFDKEKTNSDSTFTEEETEEAKKRKELDELDSLFEEAKKRLEEKQEKEEEEDSSNNSQLKVNTEIEFEENKDEVDSEIEEEASPRHRKESQEIEFDQEKKTPADQENAEEIEKKKKKKNTELEIDENLSGKQGKADTIDTLLKSEFTTDESKRIQSSDMISKTKKQQDDEDDEESNDSIKKLKNTEIDFSDDNGKLSTEDLEEDESDLNKQSLETTINLDASDSSEDDSTQDEELNDEEAHNSKKETNLKLSDSEKESNKLNNEDESDEITLRKMKQTNLELSDDNGNHVGVGKVDQIDTYYRSGKHSKNDQNWDLLNSKDADINLALGKKARKDDENLLMGLHKDAGEITIDYRMLKAEFDSMSGGGYTPDDEESSIKQSVNSNEEDDESSFKVIEVNPKGFDFAINIINLIYQKESRPIDFYRMISEEMINHYKGYPIFYSFKTNEKKHIEVFNSLTQMSTLEIASEIIEWWNEHKKDDAIFDDYFIKTMNAWICRDIKSKTNSDKYWEDVELPSWAANELNNKRVELVFPYFDGVDRMGIALIIFPYGINPSNEKDIEVTLEMGRTILLDSLQRKTAQQESATNETSEEKSDKKNVLSMFSGLFKGNKTG